MPLMYRLGQLEAETMRLDFFFFVTTYDIEQDFRWHPDPRVSSLRPSPLSKPCRLCVAVRVNRSRVSKPGPGIPTPVSMRSDSGP